jgi:hypothetical protein
MLDEQRYCVECSKWFDVDCLPEGEDMRRNISGPLGQLLTKLPIVRGGLSDPPADWMTVGSRRLVEKAKSLYKDGSLHDWGDLLGEEFVTFSTTNASMSYCYSCPSCDGVL